jgi:lipopolysaccharide biosynthesis glycosyltransferase
LTFADVDEVVTIHPTPYASIPFTGTYWGPEIYYKLEVFNLRGYERILYLDCDTIVLDDISSLWDMKLYTEKSLYAVRETAEMGVHPFLVGKFNTGVMLVNRPLLPEGAYCRLLDIARSGDSFDGGDQGVIDRYLDQEQGTSAGELDAAYNVMVVVKKRGQWDQYKNRIKILHFTNHLKPWAPDHHLDRGFDPEFKRLWDEEYGLEKPGTLPSFADYTVGTVSSPAREEGQNS